MFDVALISDQSKIKLADYLFVIGHSESDIPNDSYLENKPYAYWQYDQHMDMFNNFINGVLLLCELINSSHTEEDEILIGIVDTTTAYLGLHLLYLFWIKYFRGDWLAAREELVHHYGFQFHFSDGLEMKFIDLWLPIKAISYSTGLFNV